MTPTPPSKPPSPSEAAGPGPVPPHRRHPYKAVAAMSLNRVIGRDQGLPWHLPEDFQWFKQLTSGHVIVMGRKTFESIGRPLPHRITCVLSRSGFAFPGVHTVSCLEDVLPLAEGRDMYICGGAQIYALALPFCSDLYLTLVKRVIKGDTLFPPFEEQFELAEELLDRPEFRITRFRRRLLLD